MRRITILALLALWLIVATGAVAAVTITVTDRTQTSITAKATDLEPGTPYRVCVGDTCVDSSTLDPDPTPTPTPTPTPEPTPEPVACPSWQYDLDTYGPSAPGPCWRPFAADSPFNQAVPAAPRLASNSAAMVQRIFGMDGSATTKYPQNMEIDPNTARAANGSGLDYGHPTFFGRASDPRYTIHCTRYACPDLEGKAFPIPVEARSADGGDGHMGVVVRDPGQPRDLFVLDLGQAWNKPAAAGTFNVGYGGISRIDGDGTNVDIDSGFNVVGQTGQGEGTRAGFSVLSGMIRPPHITAGRIPHALFWVSKCAKGVTVNYPAEKPATTVCSDQTNAPPMGAHLWLDMSATDINALSIKPTHKTILRALAEFGAYMGDTGGGGYHFMFESPETYHSYGQQSPLVGVAQAEAWTLYNGRYILKPSEVPATVWDRLRVLDPCVARKNCA